MQNNYTKIMIHFLSVAVTAWACLVYNTYATSLCHQHQNSFDFIIQCSSHLYESCVVILFCSLCRLYIFNFTKINNNYYYFVSKISGTLELV